MKVLVVEDSLDSRYSLVYLLRQRGHEVHEVGDGKRALEAMTADKFDVVLMDLNIPILNGFDVVNEARRSGHLSPVIAVSALDKAWVEKVAGILDFVSKPVNLEELEMKMTEVRRRCAECPHYDPTHGCHGDCPLKGKLCNEKKFQTLSMKT